MQPVKDQLCDLSTYAMGWLDFEEVTGVFCVNWCMSYWRNADSNNGCLAAGAGKNWFYI